MEEINKGDIGIVAALLALPQDRTVTDKTRPYGKPLGTNGKVFWHDKLTADISC
jgi:hypothetical protein